MLKSLRPLDRALLLTLVPLWVVCLGLHLFVGSKGGFVDPSVPWSLAPARSPDAHPIIVASEDPLLRVGDRVLRLGDADLRGVGTRAGLFARLLEQLDARHRVRVEGVRSGEPFSVRAELRPVPLWWAAVPFAAGCVVAAVWVLLQAPHWRVSRLGFLAGLSAAFTYTQFWGAHPRATYASLAITTVASACLALSVFRAASLFPDRVQPLRCWEKGLSWFFASGYFGVYCLSLWFYWPWWSRSGSPIAALFALSFVVALLLALTGNYRSTDPLGRRRIKWILYGFYVGTMPSIAMLVLRALDLIPTDTWRIWFQVTVLAFVAIPVGVLIAISGYRFLDINPLISSTASYSLLAVVALAAFVVVVPRLADATAATVGADASSTQAFLSVALAAVAFQTHRSLRPRIDRFFFPERALLDRNMTRLLEELSAEQDPHLVAAIAGESIDRLMLPESCVVYAWSGSEFTTVFARGSAIPPAFGAESPLAATLANASGALASERFARRADAPTLSPFDRAALDSLGAAVVVPVTRRGRLAAFLCLGPKRSGDIFTPTDLALLSAVGSTVSSQLERLDDAEAAHRARSMQEELRQFVPGAVVREIEAGQDLEPRERSVSVLFVDIRGYTSFAERRAAHEVFSTINRYTQLVSGIVEKLGGAVVEFNGDGMMAVFGAPRALPEKERAALLAGREILSALETLGAMTDDSEPISVGIGIASGAALVGTVRAADRQIWTALGNTTNLAARLQGLTRELGASMVIDLATRRAAGDGASDLEIRRQVRIRGRREPEDLYVLPAPAEEAPPVLEVEGNEFRPRGKVWTLAYAGKTVQLQDAKGLHYLRRLLETPHQEVHVLDLVACAEPAASAESVPGSSELAAEGLETERSQTEDDVLDPEARAAYRARLEELREELEEAERLHDAGRRERAQEERAFLEQELSAAVGLGGRARQTAGAEERARKAVYSRVRHTLKTLAELHPELGQHLTTAIRTGVTCAYRPERAPDWRLE